LAPTNPALHIQLFRLLLATGLSEFGGHAWHVAELLAPVLLDQVSMPQLPHASLPTALLYFPVAQGSHACSSVPSPAYPMMQEQRVKSADASEFSPQLLHISVPAVFLNFPDVHATQGPVSSLSNPMSQTHAVLLAFVMLPALHCAQFPDPVTALNVPLIHTLQSTTLLNTLQSIWKYLLSWFTVFPVNEILKKRLVPVVDVTGGLEEVVVDIDIASEHADVPQWLIVVVSALVWA